MRVPIRNTLDRCVAAVTLLLSATCDVFLLNIFRLHLKRAVIAPAYRPNYARSGRRIRARL
jgi:hypothetical protein